MLQKNAIKSGNILPWPLYSLQPSLWLNHIYFQLAACSHFHRRIGQSLVTTVWHSGTIPTTQQEPLTIISLMINYKPEITDHHRICTSVIQWLYIKMCQQLIQWLQQRYFSSVPNKTSLGNKQDRCRISRKAPTLLRLSLSASGERYTTCLAI